MGTDVGFQVPGFGCAREPGAGVEVPLDEGWLRHVEDLFFVLGWALR